MSGSLNTKLLRILMIVLGAMAITMGEIVSAGADSYTYDLLGRLTGVTYSNGSTVTYAYDAAGNRTTVTQTP